MIAVIAVIGVGTKMLTGYLAARSAGVGSRGRLRAVVALIPHGEFSIVIARLAVAAGLRRRSRRLTYRRSRSSGPQLLRR